ncbi:MAG TPA: hypothetical protein VJU77_14890 [Chthoniobacterales bacterium]|nr:hypothetical protein [Chthoniobacterales bacterium]
MNAIRRFFVSISQLMVLAVAFISPAEAAEKLSDLRGVFRASFNHDASRVITISREGAFAIWELPAGTIVAGDLDPNAAAGGFVMSSDAKLAVVGFKDGHSRVFDATTAKAISPLLDYQFNAEFQMPALFSPDGTTLLLFANKEAVVFGIPSGKKIATISLGEPVSDEATGFAIFAAGGSQCFLMDGAGTVTRYDTKEWKAAGAPMRHPKTEAAYGLGFDASDDGKWVVTFDTPGENGPKSNLQVWDAITNKAIGKPLTATNGMAGHFVGKDRVLVLPGRGDARVHELPSMKVAYTLRRHDDIEGPNTLISPDRKWILVWGADHVLDLVDTSSGKVAHVYSGTARIEKVIMAPDSSGCYFVADNTAFMSQKHYDNYVVKLRFPEMEIVKTFRILDFVLGVSLSPDGKRLMVQQGESDQERLVLLDVASLKSIE